MAPKQSTPEFPTHAFASAAAFEDFLEREHTTAPGIYLKFAKKSSGIASISGAEAVEVALCFGWIDGRANSIDETWWTVRYTPRRAKSIWSQKNVTTISRLIEERKMRPAGLATVDAAKADGRWERAYAGPATMTTPKDFEQALADVPAAEAYFHELKKSEKYSVLWPLATVSEKNRAIKIKSLVERMAIGQMPGTTQPGDKKTPKLQQKIGRKDVKKANAADEETLVKSAEAPRRSGLRSRNTIS